MSMSIRRIIKRNRKRIIAWFLFLFLAVIFLFIFYKNQHSVRSDMQAQQTVSEDTRDYSPELALVQAKSFYVYDVNNKTVLFAKNEHIPLPLASITKLMSGLIVNTHLPATSTVIINSEDLAEDGDNGLYLNEKWNALDLLDFSLIVSSNDGMHALARTLNIFEGANGSSTVELMNEEAHSLGLVNTIFLNETGLDESNNVSGAYSSAYDIVTLLKYILMTNPSLVSKTTQHSAQFISESGLRHIAINTDTLVDDIPGLIASKTGYTDLAGGNLIVAFNAGIAHPIIISLLGSTEDGRFSDMDQLVHLTLEKFSDQN